MTTHRKQFASTDELNKRLEESAAIVASYEQEQPMTQQTIGNTVYRVGQVLNNYTEAAPLMDYIAKHKTTIEWGQSVNGGVLEAIQSKFSGPVFQPSVLPIKIIALPNPDPVAEDWREVRLCDSRTFINNTYRVPAGEAEPIAFVALRHAMQEVCKADEVKLEWPENTWLWKYRSSYRRFEIADVQEAMHTITLCFLLGGRVFVKGGV